MHVEHPLALALLVLVPIVSRLTRGVGVGRWTRPGTVAALTLALVGATVDSGRSAVTAVVAIDHSASIPPSARRAAMALANEFAGTMPAGDRLGLVIFGRDAAVASPPASRPDVDTVTATVDANGTDIAGAIATARQSLTGGGSPRIVLITDGLETIGRAEDEAVAAGAAGIPIDVVLPRVSPRHRVRVVRVSAPPDVHARQPFTVAVDLEADPDVRVDVSLYRDDVAVARGSVTTDASGLATAPFADTHGRSGVHVYRAALAAGNADAADDDDEPQPGATVNVIAEQQVLYIGDGGDAIRGSLSSAFRVASSRPEQLTVDARGFSANDLVVLDKVDLARIPRRAAEILASRVRDAGTGLLVIPPATGFSGDRPSDSPLDGVLPVDFRPRSGRRAPSVALALVFDRSGSMSELSQGMSKIEAARQAASAVADVMAPGDALEVIAFNGSPAVLAPLGPVPTLAVLRQRLAGVAPLGATAIAPAVEAALQSLRGAAAASASHRQVLLVSDGRTTADDEARLRSLAANAGVPISVVAIGDSADERLLREIASASGGRALFPTTIRDLPAVVAREAAQSTSGGMVREPFLPRAIAHTLLGSIATRAIPRLGGYVVGAAKPASTTILSSPLGDPVLCAWQAGVGRAAVFTGDLGAAGSAPFVAWHDWSRFWLQAARWLSGGGEQAGWRVLVDDRGSGPVLALEVDEGSETIDSVRATVRLSDGSTHVNVLTAVSPGRFEAPLAAAPSGPYTVSFAATGDDGTDAHIVRGVYWNGDRERATATPDEALLRRIAALSGGRVLDRAGSPFTAPRPPRRIDLTTAFAVAALAFVVAELLAGSRIVRPLALVRSLSWTHSSV